MYIYLLEKLRKLFKSLGKKEDKISEIISYKKFKKIKKNYQHENKKFNPNKNISKSVKIFASIAFFYKTSKIKNLIKVCKSLEKISNNNEIYIITNKSNKNFEKKFKNKFNISIHFEVIENLLNDRLLPWYHLNLMKIKLKKKSITHFAYLEDDILINQNNFNYWINSRKILKKYNLIPGFIRTETSSKNSETYAIDFLKTDKIKSLPTIYINNNFDFINHKHPYQGMYLYDRDLMIEHLNGPSSNPDCGHGAYDQRYISKRMINFDLLAKANIGLTYINVPEGFYNRMVVLYNKRKKVVDQLSCIKHLTEKYSNKKSPFGNIKLKDAIK